MKLGLACLALLASLSLATQDDAPPTFSERDRARIAKLSPVGLPPLDPTNRFSGDERAARLGQQLFFEPALSRGGEHACASCHVPEKGFTDGRPVAVALGEGTRRTPPLWNLAYGRWYFHDGRADSLWAQALGPLENPLEMGNDRVAVLRVIASRADLREPFEGLRGPLPPLEDAARFPAHARPQRGAEPDEASRAWEAMSEADREATNRAFADVGKMLAAYERQLVSRDAPFDRFVEGLLEGDAEKRAALSSSAQRGLQLFLGKGQCRLCHNGPNFTDGEFHGLGLAPRGGGMPTDPGRYAGVERLLADPFNATGPYSDAPEGEAARSLAGLGRTAASWGEFKTPSLREVTRRAPFMHAGQLATLDEVLRFYSTLEGAAPLHQHQEQILQPRDFSEEELADLLAFLASLEGAPLPAELLEPPAGPLDPPAGR